MTEDWPARVRRLEEEVAGLRRAMRTRGLIEQAKGMLAERLGCDPESAFGVLSAQSQQTNVPLVQLAADLVAAMPADVPRPPAELGLAERQEPGPFELHAVTELDRRRNPPPLSATANRNLRLAIAALDAAVSVEELARAIVTPGLKDQPEPAAAVWAGEPDGALRLLACDGWPAQAISEWRRLPSSIHTAVGHAVRNGKPVLVDRGSKHDFVLIGPSGDVRLVFPLVSRGRVVGAFQFAWASTRRAGEATRLYLSHLAVAAARALSRLWPTAAETSAELDWVRAVLDAMQGSGQLLTPLRGRDGEIIDFIIEAASGDAPAAEVGRRLLDAHPHLAGNGVFAGYVRALTDGTIWQRPTSTEETIVNGRKRRIVVSRRASRVGGAVLATWERLDEAISRDRHLARLEALGGYGWAEWDLNTGDARWSPGMYRLLGRDPGREPLSFEALTDLVDPVDRSRMERFSAEALSGRDTVVDVRIRLGGDDARWLRLFSEALERKAIHLLAQDVSDRYAREQHLRSMQSRAAAGRLRLASQQDLTARLIQLLYPKETVALRTPEAVVLGRHVLSDSEQLLRADFCDAIDLPGGAMLIMVGDMFGVGMPAAATAVRIVRPASTLGIAGLPLPRILEVLNTDLRRDEDPSLASLLLARFDPLTGDFSYASAGHLPPVWLRSDLSMPKLLAGGAGPALGLIENPEYHEASVELMVGDAVALYTDGVIDQRAVNPLMSLAATLASAYQTGGSQALLELSIPYGADEACLCLLEVRGLKHPQSG